MIADSNLDLQGGFGDALEGKTKGVKRWQEWFE
jgi:hypothetical protein